MWAGASLPVSHLYYSSPPSLKQYIVNPIPAFFSAPKGIAVDSLGINLYVNDTGNNRIRRITLSNAITSTIAGSNSGYAEGAGSIARFSNLLGMCIDSSSANLYFTDNNMVRRLTISNSNTSFVAGCNIAGFVDATGSAARFSTLGNILLDSSGLNAYITDTGNNRIRKLELSSSSVTTVAGSTLGTANGIGTAASFSAPLALALYGSNLYTGELDNPQVRTITIATSRVEFFAGSNVAGLMDTPGSIILNLKTPQTINLSDGFLYTLMNSGDISSIVAFPINYPTKSYTFSNVSSNIQMQIQNTTGTALTINVTGGTVTNPTLYSIPNISDIKTLYNTSGTTYSLF